MNYLAVLACGVASMIIGFIWYGPLFGKAYMRVMGVDTMSPEQKEAMKKGMWGMYFVQFVLSLITAGILSVHIANWSGPQGAVLIAICTWFGFIMTTVASGALWSGKPKKQAWNFFWITASAQLVTFIVFGLILSYWQ
ncbi:MAG: DUF1761 domain-containing protein [Patescibacteria group bacterium]|mgnify:CR=1 FL=1